jgi:hypothetical protein
MSRCTIRNIFTVLLYAGVGVFLFPYLTGHFSHAVAFLVAGISLAVVCGIMRCCYTDGDCPDRLPTSINNTTPSSRHLKSH